MKFDPPVQVCHGTCLQRVKRNSIYHVTADGVMAWCQRCYTSLPTVILEMPSKPPLLKRNLLKRRTDEEVIEPWVTCNECANIYHHLCVLYNEQITRYNVKSEEELGHNTNTRIDSTMTSSSSAISTVSVSITKLSHKMKVDSTSISHNSSNYECPLCKLEKTKVYYDKKTTAAEIEVLTIQKKINETEEMRKHLRYQQIDRSAINAIATTDTTTVTGHSSSSSNCRVGNDSSSNSRVY